MLKTALFGCCFKLPRQSAFCMAFDCYFVRLSFDLKDGRAARANGAYADSTTKLMVLSSFSSCAFAPASAEANRIHTEAIRKRMQQKL